MSKENAIFAILSGKIVSPNVSAACQPFAIAIQWPELTPYRKNAMRSVGTIGIIAVGVIPVFMEPLSLFISVIQQAGSKRT